VVFSKDILMGLICHVSRTVVIVRATEYEDVTRRNETMMDTEPGLVKLRTEGKKKAN